MITNSEAYNDINVTRVFFRFLKANNAFSAFCRAIKNHPQGKQLYDTFYALKFDSKGKKEHYHDDPLKWIMKRHDITEQEFIEDIFNRHIQWKYTREGSEYWAVLHKKWKKLASNYLQGDKVDALFGKTSKSTTVLHIAQMSRNRIFDMVLMGSLFVATIIVICLYFTN